MLLHLRAGQECVAPAAAGTAQAGSDAAHDGEVVQPADAARAYRMELRYQSSSASFCCTGTIAEELPIGPVTAGVDPKVVATSPREYRFVDPPGRGAG